GLLMSAPEGERTWRWPALLAVAVLLPVVAEIAQGIFFWAVRHDLGRSRGELLHSWGALLTVIGFGVGLASSVLLIATSLDLARRTSGWARTALHAVAIVLGLLLVVHVAWRAVIAFGIDPSPRDGWERH